MGGREGGREGGRRERERGRRERERGRRGREEREEGEGGRATQLSTFENLHAKCYLYRSVCFTSCRSTILTAIVGTSLDISWYLCYWTSVILPCMKVPIMDVLHDITYDTFMGYYVTGTSQDVNISVLASLASQTQPTPVWITFSIKCVMLKQSVRAGGGLVVSGLRDYRQIRTSHKCTYMLMTGRFQV